MNNTILEEVLDLSSHLSNPSSSGDANSAKIEGKYILDYKTLTFIHDSYPDPFDK